MNESRRSGERRLEENNSEKTENVAESGIASTFILSLGPCTCLHVQPLWLYFLCFALIVTAMANPAGGMLLASLLLLSSSVPSFSVYNSGECFFNTKGMLHGCRFTHLDMIDSNVSLHVTVLECHGRK